MTESKRTIGLISLIGLIVGSSIGAGIFNLPSILAGTASAGGAVVSWIIIGVGIMMLALSLSNLATKRPDIEGGIFGYAEEMFGNFGGFLSGWGYWLSSWLGNVAFATMLMKAIGYFVPMFEGGQNIPSIIFASIIMWSINILIINGVENASFVNLVATICKLVPLFVFIVIAILAFNGNIFMDSFTGAFEHGFSGLQVEVEGSLLAVMWVFVGIEGATTLSTRAKKSDLGKAIVIGVSSLVVIYMLATLVGYGITDQATLAAMDGVSMGALLEYIVGPWGATLINAGLIISILGAWLAWTMYPGETGMLLARKNLLPKKWGTLNKKGVPVFALVSTAVLMQLFMFTFLQDQIAVYDFAFSLATAAVLVCYFFVGVYQVKHSWEHKSIGQLIIGIGCVIFQAWSIYAAGLVFMLLVLTIYLPGIILYWIARKEVGAKVFEGKEKVIAALIFLGSITAIILIATGTVSVL